MKRKPEGRRVVNITHKHQRSCAVLTTICLWTVAVTKAAFGRSVLEFFRYFLSLRLPSNYYHYWSCPTAQVLVLVFCFLLFFLGVAIGVKCWEKEKEKGRGMDDLVPEGKPHSFPINTSDSIVSKELWGALPLQAPHSIFAALPVLTSQTPYENSWSWQASLTSTYQL